MLNTLLIILVLPILNVHGIKLCNDGIVSDQRVFIDVDIENKTEPIHNCRCSVELVQTHTNLSQVEFQPYNISNWCDYSLTVSNKSDTSKYTCDDPGQTLRSTAYYLTAGGRFDILLENNRNTTLKFKGCFIIQTVDNGSIINVSCSEENQPRSMISEITSISTSPTTTDIVTTTHERTSLSTAIAPSSHPTTTSKTSTDNDSQDTVVVNMLIIAGGIVGSFIVINIVIVLIWCVITKHRETSKMDELKSSINNSYYTCTPSYITVIDDTHPRLPSYMTVIDDAHSSTPSYMNVKDRAQTDTSYYINLRTNKLRDSTYYSSVEPEDHYTYIV